jgi:glycine betaine/proline transport system substrate-binding protein
MQLKLSIAVLVGLFLPNVASAETQMIRIAMPTWDSGKYVAHELAYRLANQFGVQTKFVEIEGDPMWVELNAKDGRIDIFPDLWMPNQEYNWRKYITERGSVLANKKPYLGRQGFYMLLNDELSGGPLKALHENGTLDHLDTDGNGLAEYWPGAPGWHATIFSQVKIKSYDLDARMEELDLTNAEFLTLLKERSEQGIPLMFYYWEPDVIHAKYNLQLLEEPAYTEGCRTIVEPEEDKNWLELSEFACGYPESHVYIVYRDELSKDRELGEFLSNYEVDVEAMQRVLLTVEETGQKIEDVVSKDKTSQDAQ